MSENDCNKYNRVIIMHWVIYFTLFISVGLFGFVYLKYLMKYVYKFYIIVALAIIEVAVTVMLIRCIIKSLRIIRRYNIREERSVNRIKKRIFLSVSIILLIILGCGSIFITALSTYEINYNRATSIVKKNVEALDKKLQESRSKEGNKKIVSGFDLKQDTFKFKNFATYESYGNCFGIVAFEMLYNNGNMGIIEDNKVYCDYKGTLSDVAFNENDMKKLFPDSDGDYEYNTDRKYVKHNEEYYNRLIKSAFHGTFESYDEDEYLKTPTEELSSDNLNKIINSISYIQNNYQNKLLFRYCSDEYYTTCPSTISSDYTKENNIFNIRSIIDSIDEDKLVTVCMVNNIAGHAMLAYGYEIIDDNNIRVYVSDPNFTLYSGEVSDAEQKINNDIINSTYILFTKDILKNNWSYIYRPSIEGIDPYDDNGYNFFNSFLPGTIIEVYKES